MRCDLRRRMSRLAPVVIVLAFATLGGGCGSNSADSGAENGTPPTSSSGQELFQVHLIADVSALDSGVLGYQVPATIQTGGQATLVVEVTDIGKGEAGSTPLPTGFVYGHQDVPTGAIVGVHASCQRLTCDASTPERQPVLTPGTNADWSWTLSAQSPGTARILLVATTYDQDTNIPLHVTQPIDIAISVTATPGYWVSKAGTWTKGVAGFIGFGAIVAAAQWLWRLRRKRQKSTPPDPKATAKPTKDPARSARVATSLSPRRRRSLSRMPASGGNLI